MKHYGDITKLSGYTLPSVDCITGGSPCQDLSVAGKRAGLDGKRSGLFMEQVRIVKEMRERDRRDGKPDHLCRPRYMVWENVPGAFSSNGGKDFQAVLTEICRIAEPEAPDVPLPAKGWSKAGCLYGVDGRWSIAWRVHDAQFWGVPQRRKRIALVADFGGMSAPEILFERTGLLWNPAKGGEERKATARGSGNGIEATGKCLNGWDVQSKHIQPADGIAEALYAGECRYAGGESYVFQKAISFQERAGKPGGGKGILIQDEHVGALSTLNNQSVFCIQGGGVTSQNSQGSGINEDVSFTVNALDRHAVAYGFEPGAAKRYQPIVFDGSRRHDYEPLGDVCETVQAHYGTGGGNTPIVVEPTMIEMTSTKNTVVEDGISPTLTARMGTGGNQVNAVCMSMETYHCTSEEEKVQTLKARDYKDPQIVTAVDCRNSTEGPVSGTLQNTSFKNLNSNSVCRQDNVVRRLTPLECERLQGYPDGWTDIGEWTDSKGKKHKDADSPRYKALGNSIALPFWFWLLRRISAQYERPATLGSLFDGIGGFPLCWERCNGKGTAIWASEIEEFPIAVTKLRFPEEDEP